MAKSRLELSSLILRCLNSHQVSCCCHTVQAQCVNPSASWFFSVLEQDLELRISLNVFSKSPGGCCLTSFCIWLSSTPAYPSVSLSLMFALAMCCQSWDEGLQSPPEGARGWGWWVCSSWVLFLAVFEDGSDVCFLPAFRKLFQSPWTSQRYPGVASQWCCPAPAALVGAAHQAPGLVEGTWMTRGTAHLCVCSIWSKVASGSQK